MKDHNYPEENKEDTWDRVLRLFEISYIRRNYGKKIDGSKTTGEMGESAEERTDLPKREALREDGWVKVHIRS